MLQTIADSFSIKRKSIVGINILIKELKKFKFTKVNNINQFILEEKVYFLPDKGGKKLFLDFQKHNNLNFDFYQNNQNKLPDIVLKINDHILVIESKIINNKGGSQNHSINEIISFIKQQEQQSNIHFVSCLDGNYFDDLDQKQNNKQNIQYNEILKQLKMNVNNFFIKHRFIKKIVEDFINQKEK